MSQEDGLTSARLDAPFESCGEAWEVDISVSTRYSPCVLKSFNRPDLQHKLQLPILCKI
jgi:hypothetical protein